MAPPKGGNGHRKTKRKNNSNTPSPTWLQALATRSEQAALVQVLQHLLTDAIDASAPVIPGLPRYFTRRILLSTCTKFSELSNVGAAAFHQNPAVTLKMILSNVKPDLLSKLHGYLKYMAFIEPSIMGTSSGGLVHAAISLGMLWPSLGLRIAQMFMGFLNAPPTLHKLLDDLLQLRLSDKQIRTVVSNVKILLRYAPFLLGDNSSKPAGDGMDILPAVTAILSSLTDLQVQQVAGMLLVTLAVSQPASQAWFYGLDIVPLMRYLCKSGFRMQDDAVCSSDQVQRQALLTALKVNQKILNSNRRGVLKANQKVLNSNQRGAAASNRANRRLIT